MFVIIQTIFNDCIALDTVLSAEKNRHGPTLLKLAA